MGGEPQEDIQLLPGAYRLVVEVVGCDEDVTSFGTAGAGAQPHVDLERYVHCRNGLFCEWVGSPYQFIQPWRVEQV